MGVAKKKKPGTEKVLVVTRLINPLKNNIMIRRHCKPKASGFEGIGKFVHGYN